MRQYILLMFINCVCVRLYSLYSSTTSHKQDRAWNQSPRFEKPPIQGTRNHAYLQAWLGSVVVLLPRMGECGNAHCESFILLARID